MKIIGSAQSGIVGVFSDYPIEDIVQFRLLLNLLLATQFNLEPYMKAEGGITGTNVNLVNNKNVTLGLKFDYEISSRVSIGEKKILIWYEEILEILFIKGSVGGINPVVLWDKGYGHRDRLEALRYAVVASDWKFKQDVTRHEKHQWFLTFIKKISALKKDYPLRAEEFLPFSERAIFTWI